MWHPPTTSYITTLKPIAYKIGQHILVKLSGGRIVEATIRAVIERNDSLRLQVDFGKDETAFIYEWQIVKSVA